VQERLTTLGFEPRRNTPQAFAQLIKSDIVKWAKVVRESGAKVD
jgi:tripartite-type tricarboxylate transporter receptor subunit TctC